jgi:hypothetical protein
MAKLLTGTRIYGTGTVDTQLFVNGTDQSISTTTGALEVVGGVGIGGNLYVGGISVLQGAQATNIVASGTLGITGTSTLGVVNATSATFSGTLGVTGTSVFAGLTTVTNTTSATSTSTGALQVVGGVGIGGALYVQQTSYINGAQILTTATIGNFGVSSISAGTPPLKFDVSTKSSIQTSGDGSATIEGDLTGSLRVRHTQTNTESTLNSAGGLTAYLDSGACSSTRFIRLRTLPISASDSDSPRDNASASFSSTIEIRPLGIDQIFHKNTIPLKNL